MLDFFVEEVAWDTLSTLTWDALPSVDDLNTSCAIEECPSVEEESICLLLSEASLVGEEEVDLVLSRTDPLNIAFAFLIVLVVLISLTVLVQPVVLICNSLGLEDLFCVLCHVSSHGVQREICLTANSFETVSLSHDRFDGLVVKHAHCMVLRECFADISERLSIG